MKDTPTEDQLRVIGYIENNLGITFAGKTKKSAQLFISENIEKSKGGPGITKKQRAAIDACCQLLNLEFAGESKNEARQFLMKHIESARVEVAKRIRAERREYASLHSISGNDYLPSRITTAFAYGVFGIPFTPSELYSFEEICLDLEEDIEEYGQEGINSVFVPYRR